MAVKNKGKSRAKAKPEDRGPGGRLLKGHGVTAATKQKKIKEKARFVVSISRVVGLPSDDPIIELLADLALSPDKKDRLKIGELLAKKVSPQEDAPKAISSDTLEILSTLNDFRRLGGLKKMKEVCGTCEKFKQLWGFDSSLLKHTEELKLNDKNADKSG